MKHFIIRPGTTFLLAILFTLTSLAIPYSGLITTAQADDKKVIKKKIKKKITIKKADGKITIKKKINIKKRGRNLITFFIFNPSRSNFPCHTL